MLNNGVTMPVLGFGVFQIPDAKECERCVLDAIEVGYRSIDTAQIYGNEEAVGRAAEKSGVPREELFLTTKVWISNGGYEKAKASIDESLRQAAHGLSGSAAHPPAFQRLLRHLPGHGRSEPGRKGTRHWREQFLSGPFCGPGGVLRDQTRRQSGGNACVPPAGKSPGGDEKYGTRMESWGLLRKVAMGFSPTPC